MLEIAARGVVVGSPTNQYNAFVGIRCSADGRDFIRASHPGTSHTKCILLVPGFDGANRIIK